jgi:ATP:corrinoid adenosyltransferase
MPTLIPETPSFADDSERVVWEHLRKQLPDDAVLFANLHLTDKERDYEADLVVGWPGVGFTVIEVKGGHITARSDGTWRQSDRHETRVITPVEQAQNVQRAIKSYVTKNWSQGAMRINWMLAFPHTDLPVGFDHPQAPRDRIIDQVDLATIADRVRVAHESASGPSAPTATAVDIFCEHLSGRFRPQSDWVAGWVDRKRSLQRFTEEQFHILDTLRMARRFAVLGPAGSGKTFIALEKVRRLAGGGERVALVCFSVGLARYLQRLTEQWPEAERPAFVGTFHSLGYQWGVRSKRNPPQSWWDEEAPAKMLQVASQLGAEHKFDSIVIDEAQDIAATWWPTVIASLKDAEHGGVIAFGDVDQGVFGRGDSSLFGLTPIRLDVNVRNSKPIVDALRPLVSESMRDMAVDGPPVQFIACPTDDAIATADDQVDPLLESGWSPEDIVVLTTGSRHPEHAERADRGKDSYWDSFWDAESVFYSHVMAFKGLERPVVVLSLNGWREPDRARELLYVAASRARDLLIICGDPEDLVRVGGQAFVDQCHT